MSKTMTLADIRAEAERRYGDLDIEGVLFRSLLRLSDEKRDHATGMLGQVRDMQQAEAGGDTVDLAAFRSLIVSLLCLVSSDEYRARSMLGPLDLAELIVVLEAWVEVGQPGEAPPSSS